MIREVVLSFNSLWKSIGFFFTSLSVLIQLSDSINLYLFDYSESWNEIEYFFLLITYEIVDGNLTDELKLAIDYSI